MSGEGSDNKSETWRPGEQVVVRSVWGRRIRAVWPMTVVADTPTEIALYLAPGTQFKQSTSRMPTGNHRLLDMVWTASVLRLVRPGTGMGVLAFWDAQHQQFSRWYINFETPLARTPFGFDFTDLFLDLVVEPDLQAWRLKDEHELEHVLQQGLMTESEINTLRDHLDRVLSKVAEGGWPFDSPWRPWTPDPDWLTPVLPSPEVWRSFEGEM